MLVAAKKRGILSLFTLDYWNSFAKVKRSTYHKLLGDVSHG